MGGSPCTYWSIAQKNNRETEASGLGWELFSQYVRALNETKPKYFIYENNKSMSKSIKESITNAFGFEPICINSALVSAQNRQRLYWVGKRNDNGTYDKVEISQPIDKNILLEDILECGEDLTSNDKSFCMTASYNGACGWNTIERSQRSMVAESVIFNVPHGFNKGGIKYDKSPTLTANGSWQHNNFISEPVRIGSLPNAKGELCKSQGYRIYDSNGKSITISACGGGMGAKTELYSVPVNTTENGKAQTIKAQYYKNNSSNFCKYNSTYGATGVAKPLNLTNVVEWNNDNTPLKAISGTDNKTYQVYEVKNKLITIKGKQYPIKLADGFYIIRKLTVKECMRLQTVPEWYDFSVVSDTQAYKMLGNGWTIDVISHLLSYTHD